MASKTGIEWTNSTWNPITGCSKVSQGCKNCYAERDWASVQHLPAYAGRSFTDVRCHAERLDQPLRWKRPRRVFVNSMSDLFHPDVPDAFIDRVFAIMRHCDWHIFQVLTKRPQRMFQYLTTNNRASDWAKAANDIDWEMRLVWEKSHGSRFRPMSHRLMRERSSGDLTDYYCSDFPSDITPSAVVARGLPNVWLGVSVEDQSAAEDRIPWLIRTPAAVRWISAEPLLGPLDLDRELDACTPVNPSPLRSNWLRKLDWVVCGGESGPNARPMHPDWPRSLRDQCAAAGLPFLFKQWGEWIPGGVNLTQVIPDPSAQHALKCHLFPDMYQSFRVGKKTAGRLLDGDEYLQFPVASGAHGSRPIASVSVLGFEVADAVF